MICHPFKRKRRVNGELFESREWFGALRMDWETRTRRWSLGTPDRREAERLLHVERVLTEKRHHGLIPRFKKDLALAGVAFETPEGRLDLHSLRVTFCTNLSVAGVAPRVAMELMRHSDIRLTMKVYTDPARLPLAEAVASLPAFNPWRAQILGTHLGTQTGTQTAVAGGQSESQAVAQ